MWEIWSHCKALLGGRDNEEKEEGENCRVMNLKRAKQEKVHSTIEHMTIEEVVEEVVFAGEKKEEEMKEDEYIGLDQYNLDGAIKDQVLYYDWLADSATTLHITNQREALTNYQPLYGTSVAGVGNAKTSVEG